MSVMCRGYSVQCNYVIRKSHAVILRDRVVPASQVPFPPVTIKLLQRIRTKTSFKNVISKPKVKVVEHDRDGFIPCLM